MIQAHMTYFDVFVIAVMGLSCLFAFFRGFVKEILSLGAWLGAGLITLYYFRDVAEWLKPHFKGKEIIAGGLATLGLYITALVAFSLLNSLIMRFIKEGSDVGILDNSLGLLFGAIRGALVVSVGYLVITMVVSDENEPEWLKASWTRPLAEKGAIMLARAAPDYLREQSTLSKKIDMADGRKSADGLHDYSEKKPSAGGYGEPKGDAGAPVESRMERVFRNLKGEKL